jgi:group I intron endonuclease
VTAGIYCIENLINGKKYVGQGKNVETRMKQGHQYSHALLRALNKYGKENFKFYVLIYCEEFELNYYEKEIIKIFRSRSKENGYNILEGGNSSRRGIPVSPEVKEKISVANSGKVRSKEVNEKNRQFHLGLTLSAESRNKIGEKERGEKHYRFGKKRPGSSSKYFGVSRIISKKKYFYWRAEMNGETINGENVTYKYLGVFKSELDAALAYDKYVRDNNLNRPLNFPDIQ